MNKADIVFPAGALAMPQLAIPIEDASRVAEARRQAARMLERLGFEEHARARAELALTEAATNILKHAGHGHVLLRPLHRSNTEGLEVLAIDRGPGITDVRAALESGYSTAGGLGAGMSSFARLSADCDLYSEPRKGTVLRLEFWSETRIPPREDLEWGAVCLPKAGEEACGDTWAIRRHGGSALVMVADGLGHGPDAARAAKMAVEVLTKARDLAPGALLDNVHRGIASTRGAAVGLTLVQPRRSAATFAGVGNIAGTIAARGEANRHLVSRGGIAGHNLISVRETVVTYSPGALLLMHSDGLGTGWDLSSYPGLAGHHPAVIAGVLWRDHARTRDDVTILVVRNDVDAD